MVPETELIVRAFPSLNKDWKNIKLDVHQKLIHIRSVEDLKRGKHGSDIYWQFRADKIFVNISQEEFYKSMITEDLLQKVMKGTDLVILCFGSSGTGKSYSTFGLYNRYEYRGIAPRLLEHLFKLKGDNNTLFNMNILLTYVEIIGKNIHNLLLKKKPIILKSGSKVYNGSLAVQLEKVCQGMKLMFDGDQRRNFENENSHCGTSVVTIELTCISLLKSNPFNTSAKIHIIDTAGTDFGSNATKSMKCHIDANLTKCSLNTLCSWLKYDVDSKEISCQRGSILALYLGSSIIKGYSRFVGHIKTTNEDLSYTMSTLLFGTRLRKLPTPLLVQARTRNVDLMIKGLQEQIVNLKGNIISQKILNGTFMPETISKEQMKYVMREITHFLLSSTTVTCLLGKAHPSIILNGLKEIYYRDIQQLHDTYIKRLEEKEAEFLAEREKILVPTRDKKPPSSTTSLKLHKRMTSSSSKSNNSPVPAGEEQDSREEEYDYSKLELENEVLGEENYTRTFSEFLAKSPQIQMKIILYEKDIEESFKDKCELQSKLTDLKYEINLLRIELQKEEWNTFNKTLENNVFDNEGRIFKKSKEQETLENNIDDKVDEFNFIRLSLLSAHNKYTAANIYLNDTKVKAEKQYNEYVKFMYSNTLLLPPQEKKVSFDKSEQANLNPEFDFQKGEESKKCFNEFQGKPFKK